VIELDYDKVVPDPTLSIEQGAIKPWTGAKTAWERKWVAKFCKEHGVSTRAPWKDLPLAVREAS